MISPLLAEAGSGSDCDHDVRTPAVSVSPRSTGSCRRSPVVLLRRRLRRHRVFSICFVTFTLLFILNAALLLMRLCKESDYSIYERLFRCVGAEAPQAEFLNLWHRGASPSKDDRKLKPSFLRHLHENISRVLQQHYWDDCHTRLSFESIEALHMIREILEEDKHGGMLIGAKMWNRLNLEEIGDPFRYYANETSSDNELPFTVLSYGQRFDQGMQLLSRIGAKNVDAVSFPSIELAYEQRDYIAKHLFRNAASMTRDEFMQRFSGKHRGYLLSTLNQWMVFERIANGTYPEAVFVVEDDVFLVPDFRRKFHVIQAQMASLPWEMVFVGTCFKIHSDDTATPNLSRANSTRCFNAVIMSQVAAQKILAAGAFRDDFGAVDHILNSYIVDLNITTYFVDPPLAYEQSKTGIQYPCLR